MKLMEITLVMLIISVFGVNSSFLKFNDPFKLDHFKSTYLHQQFLALAFQQTQEMDDQWGIDLRFNSNGNINRPYRLDFDHSSLVILLGTGRFYEQRLLDD